MSFVLKVKDRRYSKYDVYDLSTNKAVTLPDGFSPEGSKLFNGDIFELGGAGLVSSPVRECRIAGVLILEGNKAYGKSGTKALYKCVPNDTHLPALIVPYKIKRIGFSKHIRNKYVIVRVVRWVDKHPEGVLVEALGDVNDSKSFYEYGVRCAGLDIPFGPFTLLIKQQLTNYVEQDIIENMKKSYLLENREDWKVYSIDPRETTDIDDGFSIVHLHDNTSLISVYIANVPLWIDKLDAWEHVSDRVATIYLPHRKHSMLPSLLSNNLCSLIEGRVRPTLVLDLTFNAEGDLISHEFKIATIRPTKNYAYEDPELQHNVSYQEAYRLIVKLNNKTKRLEYIDGAHGFVEYLMVHMNCLCATHLKSKQTGIFRAYLCKTSEMLTDVPADVRRFVSQWRSAGGSYVVETGETRHDAIGVDAYVHITSPIRRIVDLINSAALQRCLSLTTFRSSSYSSFHTLWTATNRLDYINDSTRRIRRLQHDCELLSVSMRDSLFFDKTYDGIVLDCEPSNDLFRYRVYLYGIRNVQRIYQKDALEIHSQHRFRLYKFQDESLMREKIRCALYVD